MRVYRKNKVTWEFKWLDTLFWNGGALPEGWYYLGRKHIYRIMIEGDRSKQIWIAQLVPNGDGYFLVTVEGILCATKIEMLFGEYKFKRYTRRGR